MRSIIIAISSTFIIAFIIIIIQLFTREVTLDSVRNIDFDIIYNLVDNKNSFEKKQIKKALRALVDQDKVLYPMAVLTKENCIDNSLPSSDLQVCEKLKSLKEFTNYLQTQEPHAINGKNYISHSDKFFIYKKFKNLDGYLLGKAGKYIFSNDYEISKFVYFLTNEFEHYIFTKQGREILWKKSRNILFTIIIIASILSYLYLKKIKINLANYKKLLKEKYKQKKEWEQALNEQQFLKQQLISKEEEISYKELSLENLKTKSNEELIQLTNEIEELNSSKIEISQSLNKSTNKIKNLEIKESNLIKTILDQSKRLAKKDSKQITENTFTELITLKKLWITKPKWKERLNIESSIATSDGRTPFTITQAFITFDSYILNRAKKKGFKQKNSEDLFSAINFLQDNKLLKAGEKGFFHKIRVQRNEWFHYGKYPNQAVVKKLLEILDKEAQEPLV